MFEILLISAITSNLLDFVGELERLLNQQGYDSLQPLHNLKLT